MITQDYANSLQKNFAECCADKSKIYWSSQIYWSDGLCGTVHPREMTQEDLGLPVYDVDWFAWDQMLMWEKRQGNLDPTYSFWLGKEAA
jgi:hypothetical protein